MKYPRVSVVIPVYNGEAMLRECLDSVLNQTYADYEVIVVDNNSIDKTKEIIKELQNKNNKIKYIFEKYQGRGAARNTGERKAKGSIILMTDSDCIVPKNWIEKMIKPILKEECDIAQGYEKLFQNNFWDELEVIKTLKNLEKLKHDKIIGKIDTKNFAIKMNALKKIGLTNRKYLSGNDTELSIRIHKDGLRVKLLTDVKVKHIHSCSFKEIIQKYYNRAFWVTVITKDHKHYIKHTDFLRETNQTLWSFTKLVPCSIFSIAFNGFRQAYFDLITGLAWRAGLIHGWVK